MIDSITAPDTAEVAKLYKSGNAQEATRVVLAHVRHSSDRIRDVKLDSLAQEGVSAQEAYMRLHTAEVNGKPVTTSSFIPGAGMRIMKQALQFQAIVRRVGVLRANGAEGRSNICIPHVSPVFLPELAEKFFLAIDNISSNSAEEILQILSMAYALCDVMHLPEDVSGRTNEDFIVWLSQKLRYPISISENGYRGALSDLWRNVLIAAQREFYRDELFHFAESVGSTHVSRRADVRIRKKLKESLRGVAPQYKGADTMEFCVQQAEMVNELIEMFAANQWEDAVEKFPSLLLFRKAISDARKRTYHASDTVGNTLDPIVSRVLYILHSFYDLRCQAGYTLSVNALEKVLPCLEDDHPVMRNIYDVVSAKIVASQEKIVRKKD